MASSDTFSTRRRLLRNGALALGFFGMRRSLHAQSLETLHVASAGSMRNILSGPIADAARTLGLELNVHAEGADTVAKALVDGSLAADVFIPVTASPMQTVIDAGKIRSARSIGGTELVLVYSPASRFASQFEEAKQGKTEWWRVLQQSGLRIGRGDPTKDPGARACLFCLMLAARKYNQPNLVETVLGPALNSSQIIPGIAEKLKSGELDTGTAYRMNTGGLPYVELPREVNLSQSNVQTENPEIRLDIGGKVFRPEALIFFAGQLEGCSNPSGATRFIDWLRSADARSILASNRISAVTDAYLGAGK